MFSYFYKLGRDSSRWQYRRILNSGAPMDTTNLHMKQVPLFKKQTNKQNLKTSWTDPPPQNHIKTGGRSRDTVLPKTPPIAQQATAGRTRRDHRNKSFSLRSEGFLAHIRHPSHWNLYWRDEHPKYWAWKINRLKSRRNTRLWRKDIPLLQDSSANLLTPGPSTKSGDWKAFVPYVKEIHLLILRCLPKRQKPVTVFSEDRRADKYYFWHSASILLVPARWAPTSHSPFLALA